MLKEGDIMALYAMGDFHLAFSVDKPMEIFDSIWKNHEKKINKYSETWFHISVSKRRSAAKDTAN